MNVASFTRFRPLSFSGVDFNCIPNQLHLGIQEKMEREGVRVVSRERLVVDSADRLSLAGGFEELWKAVSLLDGLDGDALLELLHSYDKAILYLKVGYLLQNDYSGRLPARFFAECRSYRTRKKHYFGTKLGQGVYIKGWNLIVPPLREGIPDGLYSIPH
jgi:predicted transcriptional regulator of viral defense system